MPNNLPAEQLISVSELQKIGQDVHQMGLTDFTYWFEFRERLAPLLERKIEEARLGEAKWWRDRINSKRRANWKWGFEEVERERIAELERAMKGDS